MATDITLGQSQKAREGTLNIKKNVENQPRRPILKPFFGWLWTRSYASLSPTRTCGAPTLF